MTKRNSSFEIRICDDFLSVSDPIESLMKVVERKLLAEGQKPDGFQVYVKDTTLLVKFENTVGKKSIPHPTGLFDYAMEYRFSSPLYTYRLWKHDSGHWALSRALEPWNTFDALMNRASHDALVGDLDPDWDHIGWGWDPEATDHVLFTSVLAAIELLDGLKGDERITDFDT